MLDETKVLLDMWVQGMDAKQLYWEALESGQFPGVSARRLKNIVMECFKPRFLVNGGQPAEYLKTLYFSFNNHDIEQMLLIYTCRANVILADFIRDVYWPSYERGQSDISNQDAYDFVVQANRQGMTTKPWSEKTIQRVSSYLTGACADFGLLENGRRRKRKILTYRIEPKVAISLAYELHFAGLGDNTIVAHSDWSLFGLERSDVVAELKRLSFKGAFLIQNAGDIVQIGWKCRDPKELSNVIFKG